MHTNTMSCRARHLMCLAALIPCLSGCIMAAADALPASRLPPEFMAPSRNGLVPIDFTRLRLQPPKSHIVTGGDTLAIFVQDVIPSTEVKTTPPVVNQQVIANTEYYPADGVVRAPAVGLPIDVQSDGTLALPLVPPIPVNGLTVVELAEKVRKAYIDAQVLLPGKDRVMVTLVRPAVRRILVIREDINSPNVPVVQTNRTNYVFSRRGNAEVIDLPSAESDVLHALVASGGLPGTDAHNAVWILRARDGADMPFEAMKMQLEAGGDSRKLLVDNRIERSQTRIPLRVCPGEEMPLCDADIRLDNGDVIFLEARDQEFFYVGGLLAGGQIPLPRDYDLDVIGAMSLANGSVGGPSSASNAILRSGSGLGNVVPPTRIVISRTLANGQMIKIRCETRLALKDPRERVIIQAGDIVMLQFKPGQLVGATVSNMFNGFGFTFIGN